MPFQVGQRVGDYEIVQLLGAGGMGSVYRARNIISNRTEAMKVLLPDLTAEPDLAKRFISEIRTLAGFDHPNIAQLHTALMADNQLIMMMEYVEGYTLEQMAGQRKLPIQEVAGYVMQSLSALAYAHERGVVHRDIKPANLMVTTHGIVKLMDFGIAKSNNENLTHTRPGTTIGSMYYMSPEQVRGSHVDARSDLYSMGVVMYELLAGRKPFESDSTFGILNQQVNTPPQPPMEINPALPQALNDVILKALAKDPAQRFQSAEEFRSMLRPFASGANGREAAPVANAQPQAPVAPLTQAVPVPTPGLSSPPSPAAGQQAGFAQQPAFSNVNPPVAPQWQTQPPAAQRTQRSSNKVVWIATGAIAAVLALVAVIFALPMMRKASAASSSSAPTTPSSSGAAAPDAVVSTTVPTVATTSTPGAGTIPSSGLGAGTAGSAGGHTSQPAVERPHDNYGRGANPQTNGNAPGFPVSAGSPGNTAAVDAPSRPAPSSNAELDQAEERIGQMSARANAAKRGVGQIRSQQEAQGLGMRGDIETAEGQLETYMNSANAALARGDGAAATRALDRADIELTKIEKFLGR